MKLKFLTPDSLDKNLKATVHRSGKLGFSMEAANKLELSADKSASIAVNEDDPNDSCLYFVIHPSVEGDAFKVNKAGEYYYINAKPLFDSLKINYLKESVVYDISKDSVDGQLIYKFKRREKSKKPQENS